MFGLEEDFLDGVKAYEDTREPFEKIYVQANGGCGIDGEWEFSGSYSVDVSPHDVGNCYRYEGGLHRGYRGKGRWRVNLIVCGGASNRVRVNILSKTSPSIKQARKMILRAILDFENTNRFAEELAPEIYHVDQRKPIVKEIDGELFWVASTWDEPYTAIQGRMTYSSIQCPLGYGQFYYRQRKWEFEYSRKEDGSKDYDAEPETVYHKPSYGSISVTSWSSGGGGRKGEEMKEKINQAIFDIKDEQILKRQHIRYLSLKRI
jgi:hypothetical protein